MKTKLAPLMILVILVISIGGYLYNRYQNGPLGIFPYSFTIKQAIGPEIEKAQHAQLLLVGDRMAVSFERYLPELISKVSANLQQPLRYFSWGQKGENIHRTLDKLKKLKKVPAIIIYHGGTEEFYEKIVDLSQIAVIKKNYKIFENEKWRSLFITVPTTARIIYHPINRIELGATITKDQAVYGASDKQEQMGIIYKSYQMALSELIKWAREKNTQLILLTSPVNLEVPPLQTCSNAITEEISQKQEQIEKVIEQGDYKTAFNELASLHEISVGNAKTFFLSGKVLLQTNHFKEARELLTRAKSFDCNTDSPTPVINYIIRDHASKESTVFFDFDEMMNSELGKNTLFLDEIYPQHLYYQKLSSEILNLIKSTLQI